MTNEPSLLFLGDCNTLGPGDIKGRAYPEKVGSALSAKVINCGHTMSTTREGLEYFQELYIHNAERDKISFLAVQYGLVDAWSTFKYSPYVLYYPDSFWRKIGRKLTKKYKKWCRKLGLNRIIGTVNVIPIDEYAENLRQICREARNIPVILIETVPNKDLSRNTSIQNYNFSLEKLSQEEPNCSVLKIYESFAAELSHAYIDETHISLEGHDYIAKKLQSHIHALQHPANYEAK